VAVNTDAKRIEMMLPEGLIEVNRPTGGSGANGEDQKR
jgi:hypothetical protein